MEAGALKLVGTNQEDAYRAIKQLIEDKKVYTKMSNSINPYGDGQASEKIVDAIDGYFLEFA